MVRLVVIRGPPGSGKSSVSIEVGKNLKEKVVVFNKDGLLLGFNSFNTKDNIKDEGFIFPIINTNLKNKVNVIIDGIYGGKNGAKKLDNLKNIAKKNNAEFFVFTLNCSFKTSVQRVGSRKGHIVKKGFPLKEIKKWYDYLYETKYKGAVEIDTEKLNIYQVIKEILNKIKF
jgi:predicted ABC-type ATPase